jgi:hypothetical protein
MPTALRKAPAGGVRASHDRWPVGIRFSVIRCPPKHWPLIAVRLQANAGPPELHTPSGQKPDSERRGKDRPSSTSLKHSTYDNGPNLQSRVLRGRVRPHVPPIEATLPQH